MSISPFKSSNNDRCDMVSISTEEFGEIPKCYDETHRYNPETVNYCRVVVGVETGTVYKVNASTPNVCGRSASQEARDFVDHLSAELILQ